LLLRAKVLLSSANLACPQAPVPLPDDISETELKQYALEHELRAAPDRIRALEGAIKTTAKVLAPYAGGNGR
jgi:hypothetical protein